LLAAVMSAVAPTTSPLIPASCLRRLPKSRSALQNSRARADFQARDSSPPHPINALTVLATVSRISRCIFPGNAEIAGEFLPFSLAAAARQSTKHLTGSIDPRGIFRTSSPPVRPRSSPPVLGRRYQSCAARQDANTDGPAKRAAVWPASAWSSPRFH